MKRIIKFPLIMDNGKEVRTINELKENFNLEKVIEYFLDGKLKIWLQHRRCVRELSELEKLECYNKQEIPLELSKIFNVEYSDKVNILEMEERNKKLSILKNYVDDESWKEKLEYIVFTQEELEKKLALKGLVNILDNQIHRQDVEVYLCGEMFTVSDKFKDITYIGVNTPNVKLTANKMFEAEVNNIKFKNVKITSDIKIDLKIKEYKSCNIDYNKINLKNGQDIKYCKTFIEDAHLSIVIDNMGDVHLFGIISNGIDYVPEFDAPIIDIDCDMLRLVAAVDKNGKVYQWGSLPYRCQSIPKDLPKIKQVTVGSNIIVVLDEYGKLHWWGGFDSSKIFTGEISYGEMIYKPMPKITAKIVQVTCSSKVVMALDENGKVYSWGYCGSSNNKRPIHNIPKNLPFIKKIALFGYGDFAFALDENGKVHSWGRNDHDNSNIPKNLPCIVDISEFGSPPFSALDENGRVYIWGECADWHYDRVKKLPRLKHLVGIGGIDENGDIYSCNYGRYSPGLNGIKECDGPQFNGLKAMLPNE